MDSAAYTLGRYIAEGESCLIASGAVYSLTGSGNSHATVTVTPAEDGTVTYTGLNGSTYTKQVTAGESFSWWTTDGGSISDIATTCDLTVTTWSSDTVFNVTLEHEWDMYDGQVIEKQNCIESLTAEVYANSAAYGFVTQKNTTITVKRGDKVLFDGRVLEYSPSMENDGSVYYSLVGEGCFGYLQDSTMPYLYEQSWHSGANTDVQNFIDYVLGIHNSKVEGYKKIQRGEVDISLNGTATVLVRGVNRQSSFDTLQEKLVSALGGEMRVRRVDGTLYLDYKAQLGSTSETKIELGSNMMACSRSIDPSNVITALIPLGKRKGYTTTTASREISEYETDDRITIADANDGSEILYDDEAMAKYGYIEKCVVFDDYEIAADLKAAAEEWLESNNAIDTTVTIDSVDLSLTGETADSIEIYNIHECVNSLVGIDESLEVVSKTTSIDDPTESSAEFGKVGSSQSSTISASSVSSGASSGDALPVLNTFTTVNTAYKEGAVYGFGGTPLYCSGLYLADTDDDATIRNCSRYIQNTSYASYSGIMVSGFRLAALTSARVSATLSVGIEASLAGGVVVRAYIAGAKTDDLPDDVQTAVDISKFSESSSVIGTSAGDVEHCFMAYTSPTVTRYIPSAGGHYIAKKSFYVEQMTLSTAVLARADTEFYLFIEVTSGSNAAYVLNGMLSVDLIKQISSE